MTPGPDLPIASRQRRDPLSGVVAILGIKGLGVILELPLELALRRVASPNVLDYHDVPALSEASGHLLVADLVVRGP